MLEELEVELWSDQSGPMFRLRACHWFLGLSRSLKGLPSKRASSPPSIEACSLSDGIQYLPTTTWCIPRNCFTTRENGNYIWENGREMLLNSKLP
jgi:hypothetical protein